MKTPKGILIVLIAILCALTLATPALAHTTLNSYEKQLLTYINKERAKRGLAQLRVNARLNDAARAHSRDMATRKYFAHNSPDGETWCSRIIRFGYTSAGCSYWKVGENIYYGAGLYSSPYVVMYGDGYQVKGWMDSKIHRATLLGKTYRAIGLGAVRTDTGFGSIDGAVWFFTADFGRRIAL